MTQGIGTFGAHSVLGVEFAHSRGVSPSTGLMKLQPRDEFDREVHNLVLSYGGNSITLNDVASNGMTFEIHDGGAAFRWNCVIQDQRWKWRYPRISGTYNRRLCDGTVDPKGKKTARQLGALIATELGSSIDVDDLPDNVYPPVVWDDSFARFELAWLCDLYGLEVCPRVDNTFRLEPITATASLPAGGEHVTPASFSYKPSILPSSVEVRGTHDRQQGWVTLQSEGLDVDGTFDLWDNMSFKPSSWGDQCPLFFPDVNPAFRHLAFQYGHRTYAPADPTIILDDHVLETGLDVPADQRRCLPPQIRGVFYSHDDLGTITTPTGIFTGEFTVRKDINKVYLEYPAYVVNGGIAPAQLEINTGYWHVDDDNNPVDQYSKSKSIPEAQRTTKARVLRHPEFGKKTILAALYGANTGDNVSDLDAEAQVILDGVAATYTYQKSQDVLYDRLIFPDTTAGIAQIMWRLGNQRVATTRIGVNTEVHIQSANHQQRRAQERLNQMAERMGM
jgi:hypothetical protein